MTTATKSCGKKCEDTYKENCDQKPKIKESDFNSFRHFFFNTFSVAIARVDGDFQPGRHIITWASILQAYPKTLLVSARKHTKSTLLIGFLAWQLYRLHSKYREWEYMGYKQDLAQYQIKRAKRYISNLPEVFGEYEDLTRADTILHYEKNGCEFYCAPSGILSFKRGRHPDGLICDDILRDPRKKMDISQLLKIEKIFTEQIDGMPQDQLHVIGTPQHEQDLFSTLEKREDFYSKRFPAVVDATKKHVLWPEKYPWQWHKDKRTNIGEKAYQKEYMCSPVHTADGYISQEDLNRICKSRLKNYTIHKPPRKLNDVTYAGFDIGKKTHPSHLCVLGESASGKAVQLHSKWMDGWNYTRQLEYLKRAIEAFGIHRLIYDDTRAEFDSFDEQNELPAQMAGVVFTKKTKFSMAAEIDKKITQDNLHLINEERQKRQLKVVDNDLKALETDEGHGDAFFSLAMALKAMTAPGVGVREIG